MLAFTHPLIYSARMRASRSITALGTAVALLSVSAATALAADAEGSVSLADSVQMTIRASKRQLPPARIPSNVSAQGTRAAGYVSAAEVWRFSVFKDDLVNVFRSATRSEIAQIAGDTFGMSALRAASTGGISTDGGTMTRGQLVAFLSHFAPSANIQIVALPPPVIAAPVAPSPTPVAPVTPPAAPVASPPAMSSATHRVIATSANVRSGPNKEYRALRIVFQGDLVRLVSQPKDTWSEVSLSDGLTGFINTSSIVSLGGVSVSAPAPLQQAPAPVATTGMGTATQAINIRRRADFTAPAFDSIATGTVFTILEQDDPFLYVRLQDGREGYVAMKYVNVVK